jgi:hypothetical protein
MEGMMRGDITDQYHQLKPEDQKAFNRWLWANTIVGAVLLAGLIAIASKYSGDGSETTAQNATTSSGPTKSTAGLPLKIAP